MCTQNTHYRCGHVHTNYYACSSITRSLPFHTLLPPIRIIDVCGICRFSRYTPVLRRPRYLPQPPPYWLNEFLLPPNTQTDTRWEFSNGAWRPLVHYRPQSENPLIPGGGWNTIHGMDSGPLPPGWRADGTYVTGPGGALGRLLADLTVHDVDVAGGDGEGEGDEGVGMAAAGTQDNAGEGPSTSTANAAEAQAGKRSASPAIAQGTQEAGSDRLPDPDRAVQTEPAKPTHGQNSAPHVPPSPSVEDVNEDGEMDLKKGGKMKAEKTKGKKSEGEKSESIKTKAENAAVDDTNSHPKNEAEEAEGSERVMSVPTPKGYVDVSVDSAGELQMKSAPFLF